MSRNADTEWILMSQTASAGSMLPTLALLVLVLVLVLVLPTLAELKGEPTTAVTPVGLLKGALLQVLLSVEAQQYCSKCSKGKYCVTIALP